MRCASRSQSPRPFLRAKFFLSGLSQRHCGIVSLHSVFHPRCLWKATHFRMARWFFGSRPRRKFPKKPFFASHAAPAMCFLALARSSQHGRVSGRLKRQFRKKRAPAAQEAGNEVETKSQSYHQWWLRHRPSAEDLSAMAGAAEKFTTRPLISIVMPVFRSNLLWLGQAIASVRAQVYPHWELCIADDASGSAELDEFLAKAAESDPRIKVGRLQANQGISAATNKALELATGEWVG